MDYSVACQLPGGSLSVGTIGYAQLRSQLKCDSIAKPSHIAATLLTTLDVYWLVRTAL